MAHLNALLKDRVNLILRLSTLVAIILIANSGMAFAAQFVPIPNLEAPDYTGAATGVSQDGRVVCGWSDSSDGIRAFRWTAADGAQSLGVGYMPGSMDRVSKATAVSADGSVIVGWTHYFDSISWSPRKMAFIWTAPGGFHRIPASNGNNYIPYALSADGSVIVGEVDSGTSAKYAVIFHWNDTIETVLGGNPWYRAQAIGVSHDGIRIAGSGVYGATGYTPRVTFIHDEVEGYQLVGDFSANAFTLVRALSADGQCMAGTLGDVDSSIFRWQESTGLVDVGTLTGALNTRVLAMNESGDIMVGTSGAVDNWNAIIWDPTNGFQLLEDYATQTLSLDLQGWQLTQANAITQYAIVGEGIDPEGIQKAWMIVLIIFGDANEDNDVDGDDLYAYTAAGELANITGFAAMYGR